MLGNPGWSAEVTSLRDYVSKDTCAYCTKPATIKITFVSQDTPSKQYDAFLCFEHAVTDLKELFDAVIVPQIPEKTYQPTPEYKARMSKRQEATNIFGFHTSTSNTRSQHQTVRLDFIEFYTTIVDRIPDGREKSRMITKLEEAAMWAHKAIALQDPVELPAPETML